MSKTELPELKAFHASFSCDECPFDLTDSDRRSCVGGCGEGPSACIACVTTANEVYLKADVDKYIAALKDGMPEPVKPDAEMTNGTVTLNALNLNSWVYVVPNDTDWELLGNYYYKTMCHRGDMAEEAVARARDNMEVFKSGDKEYRLFKIQLHDLIRTFGEMGVCVQSNPFEGCQIFFAKADIIADPERHLGETTHSADADTHEQAVAKAAPIKTLAGVCPGMLTLASTIHVWLSAEGWDILREYWVGKMVENGQTKESALDQFGMLRKNNTSEISYGGYTYALARLTIAQFMAVFGKFAEDIAVEQHGCFFVSPDEIRSTEAYIGNSAEFPPNFGRHTANARAKKLDFSAGLPDDTCEDRKLPKETSMIHADVLLAKQKELAETVEAETNSKVYDEVLPVICSDVTQYAMKNLSAREIRYDIRHGQVIRHDGTDESVMFTLDLMSRVCDALRKFGYDANCGYDKTECNGTFTIKWG